MKYIDEFMNILPECQTSYNTVECIEKVLLANDFTGLTPGKKWNLKEGKGYYVKLFHSGMVAFKMPEKFSENTSVRIEASHTDHPCLAIKYGKTLKDDKYNRLNVESYGGLILNTWLDRPLGIAGIVACKGDDIMHPYHFPFKIDKPVMCIPNLAIHMNRDVNKGVELSKQVDMAPIISAAGIQSGEDSVKKLVAETVGVEEEDILDIAAYAYVLEKPVKVGINEEMLMSPAIDNIASVFASTKAIIESDANENVNMIALFDNEEVGNTTKQGAASSNLVNIIKKIYLTKGFNEIDALDGITNGFLLSLDGAHAAHPAHYEKSDPVNKVCLNGGIVIKKAARQSYSTDCEGAAILMELCKTRDIAYQAFYNRSDILGGGTLGSAASTVLSIRSADVGVPMLAMHSAVETMGCYDLEEFVKLCKAFFEI